MSACRCTRLDELVSWFRSACIDGADGAVHTRTKAIVALSGGVDSAVVAYAAFRALADGALAVTADYRTLAREELESAKRVAREIGIRHEVIEYDELSNPSFVANDTMRCYHCRNELAEHLIGVARREGAQLIVDGTNADDLNDYRPGIVAMREHGIRSPLAELNIGKEEVRAIAREAGLSVHDKPSNACLASRIAYGVEVTRERLMAIEEAEKVVRELFNVRQVRVRLHADGTARIEVGRDERMMLFDPSRLDALDERLKALGFRYVAIDARGYRHGSLNVIG
ncbi:MAG: ATP-dependent sacrificial sulfur transferase LarE [Candidatus Nitrosocaldus sp.]|nr:ATP-dependent sacrificial sulfur transferase LarE [Candidatus Nitrosocaldus sp.]MDW8000177.1 ATP-dependent sacrificial sulfur transferase LarE [Candidatus Nitrosocaldus sp.]